MKRRIATMLLVLFSALGMVTFSAASASAATTGGDIGNSSGSTGFITIWQHNGFSKVLYPGDSSYNYPGFYNDVQKFRPQTGKVCRSQYSGTSWPYKGGVTYIMSHDNLNLEMYCKTG